VVPAIAYDACIIQFASKGSISLDDFVTFSGDDLATCVPKPLK
jgi:hypothetical protein